MVWLCFYCMQPCMQGPSTTMLELGTFETGVWAYRQVRSLSLAPLERLSSYVSQLFVLVFCSSSFPSSWYRYPPFLFSPCSFTHAIQIGLLLMPLPLFLCFAKSLPFSLTTAQANHYNVFQILITFILAALQGVTVRHTTCTICTAYSALLKYCLHANPNQSQAWFPCLLWVLLICEQLLQSLICTCKRPHSNHALHPSWYCLASSFSCSVCLVDRCQLQQQCWRADAWGFSDVCMQTLPRVPGPLTRAFSSVPFVSESFVVCIYR